MSTHILSALNILTDDELAELDAFTKAHQGLGALPALRDFLAARMRVDLVLDPAIVLGFAEDSSHLPAQAAGLCRPGDERECAVIMRACMGARILMTISGGRSNLTGSATPEGGIIISTARMIHPEISVDIERRLVRAPVGAILEDVRKAVVAQSGGGLCFPVDPTSRADASLGGALACNASGFTPGEPGAMRSWIKRLRLIMPDGSLLDAGRRQYVSQAGAFTLSNGVRKILWPVPRYPRPPIKNAGGPFSASDGRLDLVDLVVGSEGLFGLVTACELDLAPRPTACLDLFFSLPTESDALKVLEHVRRHFQGNLSALSACEYFGANCRATMEHEARFFHGSDAVAIYIQQPLHDREIEEVAEEWLEILQTSGCALNEDSILLLDSQALRDLFLAARHSLPANALEKVKQRGTYTIMTDTVVPPERFAEFLDFTHSLLQAQKLDYVAFGHLGDCHLHFTILPEKCQLERGVAAYDAIIAKSAELGGVYSGEHGTGKRKRKDFLRCYGQAAGAQVRACKAAVDPDFLLNRGNVVAENEIS